jgi:hypothetical protein
MSLPHAERSACAIQFGSSAHLIIVLREAWSQGQSKAEIAWRLTDRAATVPRVATEVARAGFAISDEETATPTHSRRTRIHFHWPGSCRSQPVLCQGCHHQRSHVRTAEAIARPSRPQERQYLQRLPAAKARSSSVERRQDVPIACYWTERLDLGSCFVI